MSELKDMDWDEYNANKGYGSMAQKDEEDEGQDFDNIKINLNEKNKGTSSDQDSFELGKQDIKLGEIRKSDISTGGSSGANSGADNLNQPDKNDRCCNCMHIDYYRQYFDITTQDVLQRILFSFIPYNDKLLQAIGDRPDLYGPFWILTTVI